MHEPVLVEWADAWGSSETIDASDAEHTEPVICYDLGFLLSDNEKGVTIGTSGDEQGQQYRFVHFIPRGMVRKVTVLAPVKCRSKAKRNKGS